MTIAYRWSCSRLSHNILVVNKYSVIVEEELLTGGKALHVVNVGYVVLAGCKLAVGANVVDITADLDKACAVNDAIVFVVVTVNDTVLDGKKLTQPFVLQEGITIE